MGGPGYWLNSNTGRFFLIDEHARWLTRPGNGEKIGLAADRAARLRGLDWGGTGWAF